MQKIGRLPGDPPAIFPETLQNLGKHEKTEPRREKGIVLFIESNTSKIGVHIMKSLRHLCKPEYSELISIQ